jgi:sugar phosphate isomerase/epimerase
MPLGISSWSFHRDLGAGRLTLLDFPYKARSMGFEDMEVMVSHLDGNAAVLKERCDDAGISWNCVSAENNFAIADEQARRGQIEHVEKAIDTAQEVQARIVRAFFGNVPDEAPLGTKYLTMEAMREVGEYAEERDIIVAMENHGNYINTADEMLEMIQAAGSKNLRACPDTGNFQGEVYEELEKVATLAAHVHLKTYEFTEQGDERTLNYRRIFRIFKNAGYGGTYSLEYDGPGDETENVGRSIALFKRYVQ